MDFRIGIVIGASLWLVTAQQHPENQVCTRLSDIAEPCGCMIATVYHICGSDARTYLSRCFLNCWATLENIKIGVAHEGRCKMDSQCTCTSAYDPVCGTNGVTYANECVINCFMKDDNSIRLNHKGACPRIILRAEQAKPVELAEPAKPAKELTEPAEPENKNKKPGNCCCHSNLRRFRTRFGNNGKRYARRLCDYRHKTRTEAPRAPPPAKLRARPPSCPFNNTPPIQPLTSQDCPNQPQDCPLSGSEKNAKKNACICATLSRPVCSNRNATYANFCVLDCIIMRNPSVEFQHWGYCGNPQKTPWSDKSFNLVDYPIE